jgi:DNA polymerase-3 subunit alpha
MPYAEVDRIAKMIPGTPGMTIDKAMADVTAFHDVYTNDPAIRNLVDTAKKLEGMVRNSGVHASAVVISPVPLDELVPLYKTKNDEIVTAYDMKAIEKMGLLKMDFLGLTTLTIIDDCLKMIQQTRGETVIIEKLPLEDQETFVKVFHKGQTSGVFQFESDGMRDVLRRYQPTTVEDLTALNALYRPGPIQGGMVDDFIERKWGRKKVDYMLPELERLLKETLGVIVYQEQVMQIANVIAGYSLGEADLLRRAMGKKIVAEMDAQRVRFMQGAAERKFSTEKAGHIFDLMAQFAGYGFNKSHSAAYALVAYHTAYLKTHYPVEFMAALLTSVTGKTEDVVKYIAESREMGIEVLAPDVHESKSNFTPIISPEGYKIRFGLSAVKNVGGNAITSIIEARKDGHFQGIYDFCEKVDLRQLNKRVLESLIKSGGMDSLGRRAQLMDVLDKAMEQAQKAARDRDAGQHGLFGIFEEVNPLASGADRLPNVPDWEESVRLANEKEILGFWISGHPLEKYQEKIEDLHAIHTSDVLAMKRSTPKNDDITVGGLITGLRIAKTRKGDLMAGLVIEDMHGRVEAAVFPEAYKRLQEKVKLEIPVLVRAAVRVEEDAAPKLFINDITPLDEAKVKMPRALRIVVQLPQALPETVDALHGLFVRSKGDAKVLFDLVRPGEYVVVMEAEGYNVFADRAFMKSVEQLCGPDSIKIID